MGFVSINSAQFRHLNTTTLISEVVKTFGTEFLTFYHNWSFFTKRKSCSNKFPGLVTSGLHNSAMITDRRKFMVKLTI